MMHSMIKIAGGALAPADDLEAERMKRYKTGGLYEVEIKQSRNPDFHRKVFAFLRFCFEHWASNYDDIQDEAIQFKVFRNHMTVLAGFYDSFYGIDGRVRIEARSISVESMDQEEFEFYYKALINVAMKNIFNTSDYGDPIFNRLMGFF